MAIEAAAKYDKLSKIGADPAVVAARKRKDREKAKLLRRYGITEEQALTISVEAYENAWPSPEGEELERAIAALPQPVPQPKFRTWKDATGNFEVEAAFVAYIGETVKLRKRDGREVELPLQKLSDADQKWVQNRANR